MVRGQFRLYFSVEKDKACEIKGLVQCFLTGDKCQSRDWTQAFLLPKQMKKSYSLPVCYSLFFFINLFLFLFIFGCTGSCCCARALSSCGEQGLLSSCGAGLSCSAACGIFPAGLEPVSPALAGRFLTTAPPGKSPVCYSLIPSDLNMLWFYVGMNALYAHPNKYT